jgi:hypothetical protein
LSGSGVVFGFEQCFQGVEAGGPKGARFFDPGRKFVEWRGVEGDNVFTPDSAAANQAGAFEYRNMLRDGIEGDGEGFGEFGDARFVAHEAVEDGSSSGVAEGGHGEVESERFIIHLIS